MVITISMILSNLILDMIIIYGIFLFAFQGMSMNVDLFDDDKLTGLYPFMTAALTFEQSLENVYNFAMADPTLVTKVKGGSRV